MQTMRLSRKEGNITHLFCVR